MGTKTSKEKVMMAFREFRKSQRKQQQITVPSLTVSQQQLLPSYLQHPSTQPLKQQQQQQVAQRKSSTPPPQHPHHPQHQHQLQPQQPQVEPSQLQLQASQAAMMQAYSQY